MKDRLFWFALDRYGEGAWPKPFWDWLSSITWPFDESLDWYREQFAGSGERVREDEEIPF